MELSMDPWIFICIYNISGDTRTVRYGLRWQSRQGSYSGCTRTRTKFPLVSSKRDGREIIYLNCAGPKALEPETRKQARTSETRCENHLELVYVLTKLRETPNVVLPFCGTWCSRACSSVAHLSCVVRGSRKGGMSPWRIKFTCECVHSGDFPKCFWIL